MIIIPDIHGRKFWKKAVKKHEEEEIIFLGDYVDPYPDEHIHDNLVCLNEVIEFKKAHPDNVTLLLGNHDVQYFVAGAAITSRYSRWTARSLYRLFNDNKELFQICLEKEINGKKYIFSHAGITAEWKSYRFPDVPDNKICEFLNTAYLVGEYEFGKYLADISKYRKGGEPFGSVLWADLSEHFDSYETKFLADYQVFGHSQLIDEPIITTTFADLDVRRAFILDDKGKFFEMDGTPAKRINEVLRELRNEELDII